MMVCIVTHSALGGEHIAVIPAYFTHLMKISHRERGPLLEDSSVFISLAVCKC